MKKMMMIFVIFILFLCEMISSEFSKISGQVFDEENNPIIGAVVNTLNSKVFAYTDKNGVFTIYGKINDSVLVRKQLFNNYKFIINKKISYYQINLTKAKKASNSNKNSSGDNTPLMPAYEEDTSVELRGSSDFSEHAIIATAVTTDRVEGTKEIGKTRPIKMAREAFSDVDGKSFSKFSMEADGKTIEPSTLNSRNIQLDASSGMLTAGEINDFTKWKLWNDMTYDILKEHNDKWKIYPLNRFVLQLENANGTPVIGAKITLLNKSQFIWKAITDNTGKAELWANAFINQNYNEDYSIDFEYNGKKYNIAKAKQFNEGINYYKINTSCNIPNEADIVFVVDATGSMQDEINYLKADLLDIINKVKDTIPKLNLNLGCVFYKDTTDDYIAKYYDLNRKPENTIDFIKENNAGGGGDYPEAVHRAIDVAVNYLSWRDNTIAKIVFLVLDAPPHQAEDKIAELQTTIAKAAELGIRIVPIACSGVDKSTEYILRSIALLTNGTYTFLTNHSGIGNPHIEPTTDKYEVEKLNDVIKRIILQYTDAPKCSNKAIAGKLDTGFVNTPIQIEENNSNDENAKKIIYYPNPTNRILNVEINGSPEEIFISDISGKLIKQIQVNGQAKISIDLFEFPSGTYFVMYEYSPSKWAKGKFILLKS